MAAIFDALGFSGATFWFEAANVAVVIGLLYFILWKPLAKSFANREEAIEGSLKKAATAKEEAEKVLSSYQHKIDEAHQEAQAILEKTTKLAETTRAEIVAQAREEAGRVMEQARMEIEREQRAALADIRKEAADLVVTTAGKVMARALTPDDREHLVKEALSEVERLQ
ncbi:MAG: F0F1 ATP synthase subunit B [Firmicutes bacterium]|nr:F0F1 ATP synthase subunit B [Bacillota bacterium]